MRVTHLFLKAAHRRRMKAVDALSFTESGLDEGVECLPYRQVLLTSLPITKQCCLQPGDLRENVVIDDPALYTLSSGTIVQIGCAVVRLTFHCEPCKRLPMKIKKRHIAHKRGVLGQFLNAGVIRVGDLLSLTSFQAEYIPYDVKERIAWYLRKQPEPVASLKLLHDIGLSRSYARALPSLIRNLPATETCRIIFTAATR
jgi:MOSC domain-containing protein YiiM